ncbi:hypothetical protein KY285_010532 [Solanum tuberosum]|nr:hypothetical protein KY289_011073 [Solanum tuberosum]KAH0734825.1 hypothetical protein KY285_010532 [Solanum tuberosum]
MQASKASTEAAPGSTGYFKGVGKDPGLPEALRARMLALEDEVNMVMGQYLGTVEGVLGKFPSSYAVSSTPGIALNGHVAVGGKASNPNQISNCNRYKLVGVPLPRSSIIPFPRELVPLVLVSIGTSHFCLLRYLFLIENSGSWNSSAVTLTTAT